MRLIYKIKIHYILKSTIKGYKEYEVLFSFYSNTDVAKYLRSKKLIIDWTKDYINKFDSDVEKIGNSFLVFRSIDYLKIQYALANKTRAGDYIKTPNIISNKKGATVNLKKQ